MMIGFIGNEMTLKTTLLVWKPVVTFNGLVSWVIGLHERFQPSMTSISTSVSFSTKANLHCCTKFLSIKHVGFAKIKKYLGFHHHKLTTFDNDW
jgi:hypothetical protein